MLAIVLSLDFIITTYIKDAFSDTEKLFRHPKLTS